LRRHVQRGAGRDADEQTLSLFFNLRAVYVR
jgi:hypothetical protein